LASLRQAGEPKWNYGKYAKGDNQGESVMAYSALKDV
jgi:hypothetical protein